VPNDKNLCCVARPSGVSREGLRRSTSIDSVELNRAPAARDYGFQSRGLPIDILSVLQRAWAASVLRREECRLLRLLAPGAGATGYAAPAGADMRANQIVCPHSRAHDLRRIRRATLSRLMTGSSMRQSGSADCGSAARVHRVQRVGVGCWLASRGPMRSSRRRQSCSFRYLSIGQTVRMRILTKPAARRAARSGRKNSSKVTCKGSGACAWSRLVHTRGAAPAGNTVTVPGTRAWRADLPTTSGRP